MIKKQIEILLLIDPNCQPQIDKLISKYEDGELYDKLIELENRIMTVQGMLFAESGQFKIQDNV